MEECVSAGNPCGDGSIWPNLDTFCKQMYADIKLWAMTGTGDEVTLSPSLAAVLIDIETGNFRAILSQLHLHYLYLQ